MRRKYLYFALGVCLIPLLYWATGPIQYCGWDFRNSLWGPIHMLVHGQTPYTYSTPYGAYAGVWMPYSLGAFLWLGLLSCDMGSKLWLLVEIGGFTGMVWLFDEHHHPRLWILAACLLALFLFPPLWVHIFLGQFSMLFAILMIALAFFPQSRPWMPLVLAVGLTKPQLCMLIYPGLVIYTWRHQGLRAAAGMVLSTVLCVALLTLPLFFFYPGWVRDYLVIASSNFGKSWDLPTLFVQLPVFYGQAGYVIWGAVLVIVAGISAWLWYALDKRVAMIFSLALTPLVATYASSWDFLLMLPAFYWLLIRSKNPWGKVVLLGGMVIVNGFLYAARWHHDIQDSSQWWVPPILLIIFVAVIRIEQYRQFPFKKRQIISTYLLVFLALSGCSQIAKTTPQTLVLSKLLSPPSKVKPFSIVFLQEQPLMGHVFLLVEYRVDNSKGKISNCQALYDTFLDEDTHWFTYGGDPSCSVQGVVYNSSWGAYGAGTLAKPNDTDYSYVYGRVLDDNVNSIKVIWDDGITQTGNLNKKVYLVMRKGLSSNIVVKGLDKTNHVIYTETLSPLK